MWTGGNRLRSVAALVSGLSLGALASGTSTPAGAQDPSKGAKPAERLVLTRAGGYQVGIERNNVRQYLRPGENNGDLLHRVLSLGLRVTPSTREDSIRLQGVAGPLTVVDDLGREHRAPVLPGTIVKRLPNGKAVFLQQPGELEYQFQFSLPDERAQSLKVVQGELLIGEGALQKTEIYGKELGSIIEKKLDGFTLRVEPVRPGEEQSELSFSIQATFHGMQVTHEQIRPPQFQVDLHDSQGIVYPALRGRFTGSLTGEGFGGKFNSTFAGEGPAGPGGRGLPNPSNVKFNRYFLSGQFQPGTPLPAEINFDCQAFLWFAPFPVGNELRKVVIHIFRPQPVPKRIPFKLVGVPLPLPSGQERP